MANALIKIRSIAPRDFLLNNNTYLEVQKSRYPAKCYCVQVTYFSVAESNRVFSYPPSSAHFSPTFNFLSLSSLQCRSLMLRHIDITAGLFLSCSYRPGPRSLKQWEFELAWSRVLALVLWFYGSRGCCTANLPTSSEYRKSAMLARLGITETPWSCVELRSKRALSSDAFEID